MDQQTLLSLPETLAKETLDEWKRRLGALWEKLSTDEKTIAQAVAQDEAELRLQILITPPADPNFARLMANRKIVDATLADLESIDIGAARQAFWEAVQWTAQKVIAFAYAAI
jgi:hypothetical protein